MMNIQLSIEQIDTAIPKLEKWLKQYICLQYKFNELENFHNDKNFRREYNHFYRVRRNAVWQNVFYELMARAKKERLQFPVILYDLQQATSRYEASFASKLFATLNPSAPIIDSVVLKNLGLRLPHASVRDRAAKIVEIHQKLERLFADFLTTNNGKYLVRNFRSTYPNSSVTEEKMLDLVLWQTRDQNLHAKGKSKKQLRLTCHIISSTSC
jgi:hypothetical protein